MLEACESATLHSCFECCLMLHSMIDFLMFAVCCFYHCKAELWLWHAADSIYGDTAGQQGHTHCRHEAEAC